MEVEKMVDLELASLSPPAPRQLPYFSSSALHPSVTSSARTKQVAEEGKKRGG